jgi:tetratricopeptide (TPR) repeat protein
MTMQRFFDNPYFRQYVRLLHQLHQMIRQGVDETPEGEALRDRMDVPAEHLDPEEIDCVNGISADFYTLSDHPRGAQSSSPAVRRELKEALEARDAGDFVRALELLRKNQDYRDTATLSAMRGKIWSAAGEHEIALDFFRRAKELNDNYAAVWLHALRQSNKEEARRVAKSIIDRPADHPPPLVLQASDVILESTLQLKENEEKRIVRELIPLFEDIVIQLRTSGEAGINQSLLASAIGLLGSCHARLGEIDEAIKEFDEGLRVFPNNHSLLIARGIQNYGADTVRAVEDFKLAVQLNSPNAFPYYFLAHHYLLHDQYQEALEMASRALQLAPTPTFKADCLEWIAICQMALGYPNETVRAAFHSAHQLAPDNQRIDRNLRLFETRVADPHSPTASWERIAPETLRSLWSSIVPSMNQSLAA